MRQYFRRKVNNVLKIFNVPKRKMSFNCDRFVGFSSKVGIISFLIAGSGYQITTIFMMYLAFPTNTLMICDFESETKPIPAISLCAEYHNKTNGRIFDQIFDDFDLNDIIIDIYISFVKRRETDLRNYFLENITESISQAFYCFTLDPRDHCKRLVRGPPQANP